MKANKKTSFTMTPQTNRNLERNHFQPECSARINQIAARFDMLIALERENVSHLVKDEFLSLVVGEFFDAYPINLGLPQIAERVQKELSFDGLDVPSDEEMKPLIDELEAMSITQQMALIELIEAGLA